MTARLRPFPHASHAWLACVLAACSSSSDSSSVDAGGDTGVDAGDSPRDGAVVGDAGIPSDGGGPAQNDAGAGPDGSTPAPRCDASRAPTIPSLALRALVPAGSGLTRLVYATQAAGSDDWYLVEQSGLIRVLRGGTLDAEPLLDLSSEIALVDANDERGLLGLALAPDFATSRRFYVMLTPTRGDDRNRDVVREYTVGSAAPSRTLLALPASAPNHNGGTLLFAPDGTLYVGTGDGGGGCNDNQRDTPQDPRSQFGKILRLDPAKTAAPYAADGNPYPEAPTVLHVGLRNPFRFNIDPESKLLIIGDVGQNSYEELDLVSLDAPGKNFGWAAFEGLTATCSGRELGAQTAWERPVFVADRRGNGQCTGDTRFCDWRSVLGGQVYRGAAIPELVGTLIFGDYRGVRLAAVTHCDGVTSDYTAIARACDPNAPDEACFAADDDTSIAALTAIVRDHDGELVLVANGNQLLQVVPGSL